MAAFIITTEEIYLFGSVFKSTDGSPLLGPDASHAHTHELENMLIVDIRINR